MPQPVILAFATGAWSEVCEGLQVSRVRPMRLGGRMRSCVLSMAFADSNKVAKVWKSGR